MTLNKSLPNYKKNAKMFVREQEFKKTTTIKIKRIISFFSMLEICGSISYLDNNSKVQQ